MKYEKIKKYKDEEFCRLSGVKSATFKKMIEILEESQKKKKPRGGKPNALPGRKELSKSDMDYEIVLIDATETPITNKGSFI